MIVIALFLQILDSFIVGTNNFINPTILAHQKPQKNRKIPHSMIPHSKNFEIIYKIFYTIIESDINF